MEDVESTSVREPYGSGPIIHPFIVNKQIKQQLKLIDESLKILESLLHEKKTVINENDTKEILFHCLSSVNNVLSSISDIKPENDTTSSYISETTGMKTFGNLFVEYMEMCTDLFTKGAFPNRPMYNYIIAFGLLHHMYYQMIVDPLCEVSQEEFMNVWKQFYTIISQIKYLIHDIDFESYSSKLEELSGTSFKILSSQEKYQVIDSKEAINAVKEQLKILNNQCPTPEILKNTKNYIIHLQKEYSKFQKYLQYRAPDPYIINQLLFIVDASITAFQIEELSEKIDVYMRQKDFFIDPTIFKKPGILYSVTLQATELLQHEIRFAIGAFSSNVSASVNLAANNALQASKGIYEQLKQGVNESESIQKLIKQMRRIDEFSPAYDDRTEQASIRNTDKFISSYLNNTTNPEPYFAQLQAGIQIFKGRRERTLNAAIQRFWSFSKIREFADRQRSLDPTVRDIDPDNKFVMLLALHALSSIIDESSGIISKALPEIATSPNDGGTWFVFQVYCAARDLQSMLGTILRKKIIDTEILRALYTYLQFVESAIDPTFRIASNEIVTSILQALPTPDQVNSILNNKELVSEVSRNALSILNNLRKDSFSTTRLESEVKEPNFFQDIDSEFVITMSTISKFSKLTRSATHRIKFAAAYKAFYDSFCPEKEEQRDQQPKEKISSENLIQTLKIVSSSVSMLRSRSVRRNISTEYAIQITKLFNSLFNNDEDSRIESLKTLRSQIPYPDLSTSIQEALFSARVASSRISAWRQLNPGYDDAANHTISLLEECRTILLNSLSRGKVDYDLYLKKSKSFQRNCAMLDSAIEYQICELWISMDFLMENLNEIQTAITAVVVSGHDGLPVPFLGISEYLQFAFFVNYMSALATTYQLVSDRQFIKESSALRLAQFVNHTKVTAHSYGALFDPPSLESIEKIIHNYFEARSVLVCDPAGDFVSDMHIHLNGLTSIVAGRKAEFAANALSIFKELASLMDDAEQASTKIEKFEVIGLFSSISAELKSQITSSDPHLVQIFKDIGSSIERSLYMLHTQELMDIADILCSRAFLSLGLDPSRFPPQVAAESAPNMQIDELPPAPSFILALPDIQVGFEHLAKAADEVCYESEKRGTNRDGLRTAVSALRTDVDSAFKAALASCRSAAPISADSIEALRKKMSSNALMRDELRKLVDDLKVLKRKAGDKIADEHRALVEVMEDYDENMQLYIDAQSRVRQLESEVSQLTVAVGAAEQEAKMLSARASRERKVAPESPEERNAEQQEADDPALLEISQQLTELMDENEALRKRLKAARRVSAGKKSAATVREEVEQLKRRKQELADSVESVPVERLRELEKTAQANDEALFDMFDPFRLAAGGGRFSADAADEMEELVGRLVRAMEAHREQLDAARKLITKRKLKEANCP